MWNVKQNNSRKNNLSNVIILFEILNQILLFENYKNFGCCCCCNMCVCVCGCVHFPFWNLNHDLSQRGINYHQHKHSIDIQYTICRFHNCCRMHHMAHHEHFMTIVNKTLIGIRQMYGFFNCWSGLSYSYIMYVCICLCVCVNII